MEIAVAAANWIMSAALVLYFSVQERSLPQMSERPAFSARLHSSVRMRLPSQPLLMQSWNGARMAPCASCPQPAKALLSSGRASDQTFGQDDARGGKLKADVVDRRRSEDVSAERYILRLMSMFVSLYGRLWCEIKKYT